MLSVIWTGQSGLNSQQAKMNSISNNVANVNTIGYKKTDVSFSETLKENIRDRNGTPFTENGNIMQGTGTRPSNLFRDHKEGNLISTERDTDMAIGGDGYFKVLDSNGNEFYTRDGSFHFDTNGNFIHSASGMKMEVSGYNPTNLKQPITISENGTVFSDGSEVGKINLYNFAFKSQMMSQGDNLYTAGERPIESNGIIIHKYVEGSNVNMVDELTSMISTQRSFEFNSKTIQAADEMWQLANNLKSK